MSSCIGLFFNFIMFFIYFLFVDSHGANLHKVHFSYYIYLLPLFVTLFLLCISFSLALSSIYVVAKDIHQVWQVVAGLLFILTPIVFKLETYMKALPWVIYVNPMAGIVINFRRVILQSEPPDFSLMGLDFAYALLALLIGTLLLKRFGSLAAEKI
jgi:ABC-type polysaccharide/polyol phosphate export permease